MSAAGIAAVVSPLVSAGGQVYAGKEQAKASRYATDRQTEAAKAQMAYTQQQDYQQAMAAEAAQRANYEQWRAGQQTSNDLLQAREQRLGNLAGLIGAGPRAPITTTIPDYVPSPTPRRPTGSNTLRSFLGE